MKTELFAWRAQRLAGRIVVDGGRSTLAEVDDPVLASAFADVVGAEYLPLTIREEVQGHRYVRCERIRPGDAAYAQALAEALGRKCGVLVTASATPPQRT